MRDTIPAFLREGLEGGKTPDKGHWEGGNEHQVATRVRAGNYRTIRSRREQEPTPCPCGWVQPETNEDYSVGNDQRAAHSMEARA